MCIDHVNKRIVAACKDNKIRWDKISFCFRLKQSKLGKIQMKIANAGTYITTDAAGKADDSGRSFIWKDHGNNNDKKCFILLL